MNANGTGRFGASGRGATNGPEAGRDTADVIRVVIADDHPIVRQGLRAVFDAEPGFAVVGEAESAERAVDLAADADVVTMDLRFPGRWQGVDATRAIRALPEPPAVLVLTNYDDDVDILGAIEAGASGYLLKDAPPAELAAAVRAARAGRSVLAPAVQEKLLERMRRPEVQLTPRELEVLELVAQGLSNQDICRTLFLSNPTVKSHLAHLYGKLQVSSRTAAVAKARELGILR